MMPAVGEPSSSGGPPNILVDRVLTATVFNLMIHAAIFYGLRVIVDLYHILFLWDVPELGFLKFFKHPFHFLFTSVFSLGWLLLCAAVGVVTWMNYRRLQWVAPQKGRLGQRFINGVYFLAHFLLGMFLGSMVLRLMGRKGYVGSSDTGEKSEGLDERYSFVLQSCGIAAVYYYLNFLSNCGYIIKFPKLETASLIRLRGVVFPTLTEAFHVAVRVLPVSYLVHSIDGAVLHDTLSFLTWSGTSEKAGELSSIGKYFDVELLVITVLCQTLVVFTLKSAWATMEVLITTRVKFRIEDDMPGMKSLLLRDMMVSPNLYIKKLAYYDLRLLAEFDELRVKSLFILSHPGGFPKIWNSICKACLDQIKKMTHDLRIHVDKIDSDKRQAEVRAVDEATQRLAGPRVYFMASPSEAVTDSGIRSRFPTNAMRNLNPPFESEAKPQLIETNGDFYSEFWDNPFAPVAKLTTAFFDLAAKNILKILSALNLVKYFKGGTDMNIASIFKDQETVLWSAFALTDIVVASKRIDSKGVVQSDISSILTSLTDLCTALDDFRALQDGRTGLLIPNAGIKSVCPNTAVRALVQGVRRPLKNEIMRIHTNFRAYYDIISIPSHCEQMLNRIALYD